MTRSIYEADLETPEVDAAEQAIPAVPGWQGDSDDDMPTVEPEPDRFVEYDDDYR